MQKDFYYLLMPSGRRFVLDVETPLSVEDRAWIHKLVDLIFCEERISVSRGPLPTEAKGEA